MKNRRATVLLACLLICASLNAIGENPCDEAAKLRVEQFTNDAALKRKRADIRTKVAELKLKDSGLELKMADLMEENAKTTDIDKIQALVDQIEKIGVQRENLYTEMDKLSKEYVSLSMERVTKNSDYRYNRLIKNYECLTNQPLTDKLNGLTKKMEGQKISADPDYKTLTAMIQQRESLLKGLKGSFEPELPLFRQLIKDMGDLSRQIDETVEKENKLDAELDKKYEQFNETEFEKWLNIFDSHKSTLNNLSQQILDQLNRLE